MDGGASELWQVAASSGKGLASFELDFAELTFWTMLISGLSLSLSDNGADQISVQALMSTKNEKAGRRVLLFNAFAKAPATLLLLGIGVALWVYYHTFPERLQLGPDEIDKIVPYFVITELPAGLTGLVVAGIFAASMNGFDSGLNSIVACFTVDWYERVIRPGSADSRYLKLAKVLSLALGALITLLSIAIYRTGIESIIDSSNTMLGFFGGPLLGIFLLGALTTRATTGPTLVGTILSVVTVIAFDRWQSMLEHPVLHSYMYSLIGCLLTMCLGYLGSCLVGARKTEALSESA
jgi:Na+/proline symporter